MKSRTPSVAKASSHRAETAIARVIGDQARTARSNEDITITIVASYEAVICFYTRYPILGKLIISAALNTGDEASADIAVFPVSTAERT
jgi:hypothetical protein